jgi:hypothetical protein
MYVDLYFELSLNRFQAPEDDCSNAQPNLGDKNSQAVLRSRGGVRVVRLDPFDPLSATIYPQPPGTRKVRRELSQDFSCEYIFWTGVLSVTRRLLKKGRMKTGD